MSVSFKPARLQPDPTPPAPLCGTKPPFGAWSFADQTPYRPPVVQQPAASRAVPIYWAPPTPQPLPLGIALNRAEARAIVRRAKTTLGLNNVQLAEQLGVKRQAVSAWSAGSSGMKSVNYQAILALLEAS